MVFLEVQLMSNFRPYEYSKRKNQFLGLLTEERGILEPSKILNAEFYRWTTTYILLPESVVHHAFG